MRLRGRCSLLTLGWLGLTCGLLRRRLLTRFLHPLHGLLPLLRDFRVLRLLLAHFVRALRRGLLLLARRRLLCAHFICPLGGLLLLSLALA